MSTWPDPTAAQASEKAEEDAAHAFSTLTIAGPSSPVSGR
jgi:hypothetical protein